MAEITPARFRKPRDQLVGRQVLIPQRHVSHLCLNLRRAQNVGDLPHVDCENPLADESRRT
jgi:hypothetical protein